MPDADGRITIRGIDPELFVEARAAAIKKRQNIGQWINDAMAAKLKKETRKGER